MCSKVPIHELQLTLIDCLEQTSSVSDFSMEQSTYNSMVLSLTEQLLAKEHIKNNYFLKFEKQIIEEENDDDLATGQAWFIRCTVYLYKEQS